MPPTAGNPIPVPFVDAGHSQKEKIHAATDKPSTSKAKAAVLITFIRRSFEHPCSVTAF